MEYYTHADAGVSSIVVWNLGFHSVNACGLWELNFLLMKYIYRQGHPAICVFRNIRLVLELAKFMREKKNM